MPTRGAASTARRRAPRPGHGPRGAPPARARSASALVVLAALGALLVAGGARAGALQEPPPHQPVVQELARLLATRPALRADLEAAVARAGLADLSSTGDFFALCDQLLTAIPREPELAPRAVRFYFVIDQAPDDRLNRDPDFAEWIGAFAREMGRFLDTPASAAAVETFASQPSYHIDDYVVPPSGWLTFNQFFAREIKPGKRPVAAPCDDAVVVSPADAVFMGQWPIAENSTITVKGVEWSIAELLDGSPYEDAFRNGTYMHSFLSVGDYHRYHLPVAGEVKEVRTIHGRYTLDVVRNDDGSLRTTVGDAFQFNQERGLVVVDSPKVGLVAILPVGMAVISSVNLTPDVGARLRKGDPFGYFLFGGSDIVMLFQDEKVVLDAQVGTKYLQGERIGSAD